MELKGGVVLILTLTLLLSTTPFNKLLAACEEYSSFNVSYQAGQMVFTVSLPPAPSSTLTWTATTGGLPITGSGNIFILPIQSSWSNQQITVSLNLVDNLLGLDGTCMEQFLFINSCEAGGYSTSNPSNGCTVTFTPLLTNPNFQHHWAFQSGNPGTSILEAPMVTFPSAGVYNVSHYVTLTNPLDPVNPNQIIVYYCENTVTVACGNDPGDPGFTSVTTPNCCELTVCFTANSNTGTHVWDFGDGTTGTGAVICHTYSMVDTYVTPTVNVGHSLTLNGVTTTISQVVTFGMNGIFIGKDGATTVINSNGPLSFINGSPLLPGNTVSNKNLSFAGIIQFEKNFTLTTTDVCMNPESVQRLPSVSVFYDNNSLVHGSPGCCLWKGIEIESGSTISIANQSQVQDALYAIEVKSSSSVINMVGARLVNNYIGIFGNTNMINLAKYEDNLYTSSDNMACKGELNPEQFLPPYSSNGGYCGIYAWLAGVLNIPEGRTSTFQNLALGIKLHETSGKPIRAHEYIDIQDNVYPNQGIGLQFINSVYQELEHYGENFFNARYGIAINCFGSSKATSRNNTISGSEVAYDIIMDGNGQLLAGSEIKDNSVLNSTMHALYFKNASMFPTNLVVRNNELEGNSFGPNPVVQFIDVTANPKPLHNILVAYNESIVALNQSRTGLDLTGIRGITARNNVVDIFGAMAPNPRGIYLKSTIGTNVILENFVIGSQFGDGIGIFLDAASKSTISTNSIYGWESAIRVNDNSNFSAIACNKFSNSNFGLYYTITGLSGTQPNRHNEWLGGIGLGARHFGSNFLLSQYIVPPSGIQNPLTVLPSMGSGAGNWFRTTGNNASCAGASGGFAGDGGDREMAKGYVQEELNHLENGYRWVIESSYYNAMKEDPSAWNGDEEFTSFYQSMHKSHVGIFHYLMASAINSSNYNAEDSITFCNWMSIQTNFNANYNEQLNAYRSSSSTAHLNNMLSLINEYNFQLSTHLDFIDDVLAAKNNVLDEYSSIFSSIATNGTHDAAEAKWNAIYLSKIAKGLRPSLDEQTWMATTAQACPYEVGAAAATAQAWWWDHNKTDYSSEDCTIIGERQHSNDEAPSGFSSKGLRVYPQPADQSITLQFVENENSDYFFRIYDSQGRMMNSQKTSYPIIHLSTVSWPSGLYLFECQSEKGNVETHKILIQH